MTMLSEHTLANLNSAALDVSVIRSAITEIAIAAIDDASTNVSRDFMEFCVFMPKIIYQNTTL